MGYAWERYRAPYFELGDVVLDKEKSANAYMGYMYLRLLEMFEYENLPETIPHDVLEYYLLRNGSCFITEEKSQLWCFIGNPGGEPDPYYRPTRYVCANPALGISFQKDMWGDEGVFCVNDSMWIGLDPLIRRYSYLMAENLISMRSADIMLRIVALLTAHDDASKASADQYIKDIVDGKLTAVGDNPFFDGITLQSPPSNNGSYLTQFIELHQYYKGSFFNEIGLRANFNMKREAIGVGEAALGEDSLLPLCDNMLQKRKEFCERVNSLYGTDISVDFTSIWKEKRKEAELDIEGKEAEIEATRSSIVNSGEGGEEDAGDSEDNNEVGKDNNEDGEDNEAENKDNESENASAAGGSDLVEDGEGESDEDVEPAHEAASETEDEKDLSLKVEVDVELNEGKEEDDAGEEGRTEDSERAVSSD